MSGVGNIQGKSESTSSQPVTILLFTILGLTNNFAYVVMLSTAHGILKEKQGGDKNNGTANATTVAPVISTTDSNGSTPAPGVDICPVTPSTQGSVVCLSKCVGVDVGLPSALCVCVCV